MPVCWSLITVGPIGLFRVYTHFVYNSFLILLKLNWIFTNFMYHFQFIQGDLASRNLVLESKRFYLDVKENKRGRFIKIAEISADGRKNQILMTFSTAALFNQNLLNFIDFYHDLAKLNPDQLQQVLFL